MTDQSADARRTHYAGLLAALGGTRRDPASERFDEELASAEAIGAIDPAVARTLRWWQRESVRAVEDHLQSVLPGLLVGLEVADAEAVEAVAASAESWAAASGGATGRPLPPPPDAPGPVRPVPTGPGPSSPFIAGPSASGPSTGGASTAGGSPQGPGDPTTPHLRPVDRAGTDDAGAPQDVSRRRFHPGFAPPDTAAPLAPPTAPPSGPVAHDSLESGAPTRRLLVAGLTVLPDVAPKEDS
jgi:hypothetical protein